MNPPRSTHAAVLAILLALYPGCRGCQESTPPEAAAALALFALAERRDPDRQELADVVLEELLAAGSAELLDSLEQLGRPRSLEIVRVVRMPELDRAAVDLQATLPGEGIAAYTVQTAEQPDGTWRVVWFQGPGVVWPHAPRRPGEGLSTWPTE